MSDPGEGPLDPTTSSTWDQLEQLSASPDSEKLEEFVEALSSSELAQAMAHLGQEERAAVLCSLEPDAASELIERLPALQAAEILDDVEPVHAASILEQLPPAECADLVGEIDQHDADEILSSMGPSAARSVRRLAAYDSHCAGGLMSPHFLRTDHEATLAEVRRSLETEEEEDRADIQYVYVLGPRRTLTGVLPIRSLIFGRGRDPVTQHMHGEPVTVLDSATLDELSNQFRRYRFLALPVVSARGRMLGVVTRDAVEHALADQRESDHLKSQGIVREELRSMPFLRRASRRLSWLSTNILLNFVAASVIAIHQDTLAAAIALAVFLPIISDMSGCSGNQAVAVSMRELSLGLVAPTDAFFVWLKEVSVGLVNGSVLGLLLGGAAWIWKGNPWLGLVVGVALALNTILAVSLGGCLPLLLRRMRLDPAVAAGPLLTTATDLCGFFLVLSIASTMLERMS